MRSLDDRAAMLRGLAERSEARGHERTAAEFARKAEEAVRDAATIREMLERPTAAASA